MAAVIPAPSAKGPRQQFKIDVCALFTRYFSISAPPTIRLFAESALFCAAPRAAGRERFLRLFRGPQRDDGIATIRHIIPNASLSFNRCHLPFKGGGLFPTARFDGKGSILRMENVSLSLSLFRRYSLNEFCFIHPVFWLEWSYGDITPLSARTLSTHSDSL